MVTTLSLSPSLLSSIAYRVLLSAHFSTCPQLLLLPQHVFMMSHLCYASLAHRQPTPQLPVLPNPWHWMVCWVRSARLSNLSKRVSEKSKSNHRKCVHIHILMLSHDLNRLASDARGPNMPYAIPYTIPMLCPTATSIPTHNIPPRSNPRAHPRSRIMQPSATWSFSISRISMSVCFLASQWLGWARPMCIGRVSRSNT
jgi:hypothetical protein